MMKTHLNLKCLQSLYRYIYIYYIQYVRGSTLARTPWSTSFPTCLFFFAASPGLAKSSMASWKVTTIFIGSIGTSSNLAEKSAQGHLLVYFDNVPGDFFGGASEGLPSSLRMPTSQEPPQIPPVLMETFEELRVIFLTFLTNVSRQ